MNPVIVILDEYQKYELKRLVGLTQDDNLKTLLEGLKRLDALRYSKEVDVKVLCGAIHYLESYNVNTTLTDRLYQLGELQIESFRERARAMAYSS